jgi:hypothetical protein
VVSPEGIAVDPGKVK